MQNPAPNPEMNMQHGECAQPAPAPQQGPQPAHNAHQHHGKPRPRRSFLRRFITGYLMITGALVNIVLIIQILLQLAVFITDRISFM